MTRPRKNFILAPDGETRVPVILIKSVESWGLSSCRIEFKPLVYDNTTVGELLDTINRVRAKLEGSDGS